MLQEQETRSRRCESESSAEPLPFLAAKRRIGQHHVEAVLLLNVGEVLGQRIRVDDVRRFDAMQDHVHDRDDVGQRFLFFAVEGLFLQRLVLRGRPFGMSLLEVVIGFAQEACRANRAVVNLVAQLGLHDFTIARMSGRGV